MTRNVSIQALISEIRSAIAESRRRVDPQALYELCRIAIGINPALWETE